VFNKRLTFKNVTTAITVAVPDATNKTNTAMQEPLQIFEVSFSLSEKKVRYFKSYLILLKLHAHENEL